MGSAMQSKSLLWVCLALAGVSASAQAQEKKPVRNAPAGTVYKQTLPDGSVVYTDNPNRAHKIEKTLAPEPRSVYVAPASAQNRQMERPTPAGANPGIPGMVIPGMPPLPGDSVLRPAPQATNPANGASPTIDPRAALDAELRKAEDARATASQQLNEGAVAKPGERTGTASGGSRLNEDYQKRQNALDEDVKKANQKIDNLLQQRKAL